MKNPRLTCIPKVLICALCVLCGHQIFAATEVEAEGRAAGDQRTAREQALADALREAVRVGVGVDVLSSSGVSDFTLGYDLFSSELPERKHKTRR